MRPALTRGICEQYVRRPARGRDNPVVRVVHLTDRLTDRGGAHRHLLAVAREQARCGHEVHIAAGATDDGGDGATGWAAIHVLSGLESRTARKLDLEGLLRGLQADVVHVHTVVNPVALAGAAAWGAVFTIQDHRSFCPSRGKWTAAGAVCATPISPAACAECFSDPTYFEEMIALTQARLDAVRASTVVVLSEYMRGELVAAGLSRERIHVVPPFVDFADDTRSDGRDEPDVPDCVLFVGRLVAAKGPRDAVEAWRASGVDLPLVVAGTGPLRAEIEAMGADVRGWVPHHALPGLLRRARALLMPSRWQEPFGIAGLEALWHGVPVVAWDSGGLREWHPGPLAAWGDVAGLARALPDAIERTAAMPRGFEREVLMQRLDDVYARVR
jgi:glycosyltransferase involved in cell wall biosynthesis